MKSNGICKCALRQLKCLTTTEIFKPPGTDQEKKEKAAELGSKELQTHQIPLEKGFPVISIFVENPDPLGQRASNSGDPFRGHSSHSKPHAAPTEQQQASIRCRPGICKVHCSSSCCR